MKTQAQCFKYIAGKKSGIRYWIVLPYCHNPFVRRQMRTSKQCLGQDSPTFFNFIVFSAIYTIFNAPV